MLPHKEWYNIPVIVASNALIKGNGICDEFVVTFAVSIIPFCTSMYDC